MKGNLHALGVYHILWSQSSEFLSRPRGSFGQEVSDSFPLANEVNES